MSSVYEKNIEVLRIHYPEIADAIDRNDEQNDNCEKLTEVYFEEVCGKNVLAVIYSGNVYQLDSLYDDTAMLDVWFKGLRQGDWPLDGKLLMFGFGSGMYAKYFLEHTRNDCSLVVHEPSLKIFKRVLQCKDISAIVASPRVKLVFATSVSNKLIREYYEDVISYLDMKYLAFSVYLNYSKLFAKEANEFANGIAELKDAYEASAYVYDRFGGYFSRNALLNCKYIRDSYSYTGLRDAMPKGQTAIIVSAGPSLDKNIDEIKRAQGKAFIIATITALKPLLIKGIRPDITVITDGKKDERYMSEEGSQSVPMICTAISGHEILKLQTCEKYFIGTDCKHIEDFISDHDIDFATLEDGGSVANTCYSVARECGCSTVILVGQDLAYTNDKTHSAVTVRGAWNTKVDDLEHPLWDVDVYGNPIRTSIEFKLYKRWFEEQFAKYPEIKVIDSTEGGIKIAGTDIMPLKKAISEFCTEDFSFDNIVKNSRKLFDENVKAEFEEYIRCIPGQFENLRRIIRETSSDYASMRRLVETGKYHTSEMKKLYINCKNNNDRIENIPIVEYVHYQMKEKSSELLSSVNKLEKDEKTELLSVCDMGQKYLEDMQQAIDELQPFIEEVKNDFCM